MLHDSNAPEERGWLAGWMAEDEIAVVSPEKVIHVTRYNHGESMDIYEVLLRVIEPVFRTDAN